MAQLVAHLLCKQGVRGSSPLGSTTMNPQVSEQFLLSAPNPMLAILVLWGKEIGRRFTSVGSPPLIAVRAWVPVLNRRGELPRVLVKGYEHDLGS